MLLWFCTGLFIAAFSFCVGRKCVEEQGGPEQNHTAKCNLYIFKGILQLL